MQVNGWGYVAVFTTTTLLTLLLTPLAIRVALRRSILDAPSAIKAQNSPVPYLGGAAILVAFTVAVLGAAVVHPPTSGLDQLGVILGLAVGLALLGLVDDLRGMSPALRLAFEVAAGVVVWATPAGADVFHQDLVNLVVTVVWVVGVTNAFNLLDNMDGLSAGVAGIAAIMLFVLAQQSGQFLVATLAIALAGCAAGFLRSNVHPARVYMGDAGALFLGFLLSVLALKLRFPDAPRLVGLSVPILVLGVPLFDTTLVTINRLAHGRNPVSGGRDHSSHRLVFVGIPVPVAVALIWGTAASLGVLAYTLSRIDRTTAVVLVGWVLLLGALLGALFSAVPVYETSRRRHLMLQEVAKHEVEPESLGDEPDDAVAS